MGTHPIFESDFDCLTGWTNKWRLPRASPSESSRARGDVRNRFNTSLPHKIIAILLSHFRDRRHRVIRCQWIRLQIRSWQHYSNVQFVSIMFCLLSCSVRLVIWSVLSADPNYRYVRHAVVQRHRFEIWQWKRWRRLFTFLVDIILMDVQAL